MNRQEPLPATCYGAAALSACGDSMLYFALGWAASAHGARPPAWY